MTDLPLNVEFAAAYLDGAMEGEHPEIGKQWRIVRQYLEADTKAEAEVLRKALERIAREAAMANDTIALTRDGSGSGRVKVATAMHRIAETARAALNQGRQAS